MDNKTALLLEKVLMALLMSLVISWAMLLMRAGFTEATFKQLLSAWGLAFMVALPTSLAIGPVVKKLVFSFVANSGD
jgi:hypothetical protein